LELLEEELKHAIRWKLSERFKTSKDNDTYECYPPKLATKKPYKSDRMFLVMWRGYDHVTG